MPMLLAIDVGNTRIKYAVFEQDTVLELDFFFKSNWLITVEKILLNYPKIQNIVVASVGSLDNTSFLPFEKRVHIHFINHKNSFPFENLYETPTTLGIDRMVLATGAVLSYPKQNRLVIDAGTCVTYDFINADNQYLGGAISPGIKLRYESLHQYTAKLPLLTRSKPAGFIGHSTNESIHSGVINGLVNEIDGFVEQCSTQYSNFIIILTGGDADFLAKRLKNTIFAHSNFLLESLNQTYQYKIKND